MTFFGRETSIGKLEIDIDAISADSPKMQKRLDRIFTNYERLYEVLAELEGKIAQDERLKQPANPAIEESLSDPNNSESDLAPGEIMDARSAKPKKPR